MTNNHWVINSYIGAPKLVRMHVGGRWRLFPFSKLERYLPPDGTFLDVGCGYGQWPLFMGYVRPNAEVFGYDPDKEKIEIGKEAIGYSRLGNVHLSEIRGKGIPWKLCRLVTIIDVLYLIPFEEQEKILRDAYNCLFSSGNLLIKEMDNWPRWKYVWNWIEEWMAVRILRITMGNRFYFRSQDEWETLLKGIGYSVTSYRLDQGYLHPHILLVGEKP